MDIESPKPEYQLSQVLFPHSAAVRSVDIKKGLLVTVSIDATAHIYKFNPTKGIYESLSTVNFFGDYLYAVSILDNLNQISVGCKDNNVYIFDLEGNPLQTLQGHSGAVNSLHTKGNLLVSGSWDGTAKVWVTTDFKCYGTLTGHQYATAVYILSKGIILTGSQDKKIRAWDNSSGNTILVQEVADAHEHIIREFSEVNPIGFVSCSNDETIKLWSYSCENLAIFRGHDGFIYSVSCNLAGDLIASGGEDRNLKILFHSKPLCDFRHPGGIWKVGFNDENNDIITACTDGMTRVFTNQCERYASVELRDEFAKINAMAGELSPEELAKIPDISQMSVMKSAQNKNGIQLFRNGQQVEVYEWKNNQWNKIGDVEGAGGASSQNQQKKYYHGDKNFPAGEYDHIFDVEFGEGNTTVIPMNVTDNPLETAEKFLTREKMSKAMYLDQVIKFLRSNIGQMPKPQTTNKQQGGPKPHGGTSAQKAVVSNVLNQYSNDLTAILQPIKETNFFTQINMETLKSKLIELNEALAKGAPDYLPFVLNERELIHLGYLCNKLKDPALLHLAEISTPEFELFKNKLLKWPAENILPVLDLFRLLVLHHQSESLFTGVDSGLKFLVPILGHMASQAQGKPAILILGFRLLSNMVKNNASIYALCKVLPVILELLNKIKIWENKNANIMSALVTFFVNMSQFADNKLISSVDLRIFSEIVTKLMQNDGDHNNTGSYIIVIYNLGVLGCGAKSLLIEMGSPQIVLERVKYLPADHPHAGVIEGIVSEFKKCYGVQRDRCH